MEDYDTFVQRRISQLRREEEEEQFRPSTSVIRFHGRAILPPLLSGKQREEMQHYREEMQNSAVCGTLSDDPRLACVQRLLHSVQLRKTPTLDELLEEPEITTQCLYSCNTSNDSVPPSAVLSGTKESLSAPASEENSSFCLPPLTSTTYSAFCNSDRTTQQTYHEGCLIDQPDSQQESQPSSFNGSSHQSLSSGYVTYVNVENSPSVSGRIDAETESPRFGSSQGFFNMGGFSHHNTSSTIAKMPDIISHPPVDGEVLERSGLEMSLCTNTCGVKHTCGTSLEEESTSCDRVPTEKSESGRLDSVEHEDNIPSADCVKDENVHQNEESDNQDVSQILEGHPSLTTAQHILHSSKEAVPIHNQGEEADSVSSEEPYRLSLQALLKKSQEYRRRQRMLRNQAKNAKMQERTQEQPRARTEEQNLSDKENDEFSHTGAVTAEGKKTKESRGTFIPSVEMSTKKSRNNDKMVEGEFISENMNDTSDVSTGEESMKELTSFEEGTTFRNNQLNVSQKIITSHKQSSCFIQQQPASAEPLNVHNAFYLTAGSTSFHKGPRKYRTVPVPPFCRSPTTLKSEVKAVCEDAPRGKSTFSTSLNEQHKGEGVDLQHQNNHTVAPSAVSLIAEGDVTSFLAKSSQNIDQLESNLSILKVLISDLESTVKENLDDQCQTESNTQNESSFKSIKLSEQSENHQQTQPGQSNTNFWEDILREDGGTEADHQECSRRQSLNSQHMKMFEDLGPDSSFSDVENILLTYQEKEAETVNEKSKEERTKTQHGGYKLQNLPATCIFSAAQRRRTPDTFQTAPSEPAAPRGVPVLSDTSNHHPVERREKRSAGGHSSCSPSLNRSYDVDTPSGLWLHEGSGSGTSSQGHLVQEKTLTPESRSEGEEGFSKVKRRLLMHMTEERTDDGRSAGGSAVRSRSPKAAALGREANGAQKDKREQLKEIHAAQVRALQAEHRKQQEEMLQALAERYRLLQSVSFPCSMSSSRLRDTVTFSTPSKPSSSLSQHYRPLLAAVVKGFLTRRLLRTERVAQLVRTIRDTRQFLQAFQQQLSPGTECSRQDLLLQERVTLQLRAARYEVHDIFFSLSVSEQMQLISWDRALIREREIRRQSDHPRRKSSLSAATQKSLERKRGVLIQKKAAEINQVVRVNTRRKTGVCPEQLPETKRGQFRANPQRLSKSTFSSRPR